MTNPSNADPADPLRAHPLCRLCRDGTYATQSMQSFVDGSQPWPWDNYCDPCGKAFASVIKDSQGRDAEIRVLPTPPSGKAPPKVVKAKVEVTPKLPKGAKSAKSPAAPPPVPMVATPAPPQEVRPRMSLAEAMRPTAPKPPPAPPPTPPSTPKSAKNALRDAVRDVEGYDLLTMLGMKR